MDKIYCLLQDSWFVFVKYKPNKLIFMQLFTNLFAFITRFGGVKSILNKKRVQEDRKMYHYLKHTYI